MLAANEFGVPLIHSFIIHLDRAAQRKDNVGVLKALLPGTVEIVDAIDARNLTDQDRAAVYRTKLRRPHYPFTLSDNEIACFLSHRKAWQLIADGEMDFGLVAEDDVISISDEFHQVIEFAAQNASSNEIVRFPKAPHRERGQDVAGDGDVKIITPVPIGLGMQMQLIGQQAARRLLAMTRHFDRPVDTFMQMNWVHGVPVRSTKPQIISEISKEIGGSTVQRTQKSATERLSRVIARPLYRAKVAAAAKHWALLADKEIYDTLIVVEKNRYGLGEDTRILRERLEQLGHSVGVADCHDRTLRERLSATKRARQVVHLERVFPKWRSAGAETIVIPNPEWFRPRLLRALKKCDRIYAKTDDGYGIFSRYGVPTFRLGFTSPDRFDPAIEKQGRAYFHLAGGSFLKGTDELIDVWRQHPEWPTLTVLKSSGHIPEHLPANINLISEHIPTQRLRELQNSSGVHICPSRAEGWGHYIVEAMSVASAVITTDAAPMNEFVDTQNGFLAAYAKREPRKMGTMYFVDKNALEQAIQSSLDTKEDTLEAMGRSSRQRFTEIEDGFKAATIELFGDFTGKADCDDHQ